MATTQINLSSTRIDGHTKPYKCKSASLKQGAFVIHDSSDDANAVKAPTGAGGTGYAGVITNFGTTASGDTVDVQYDGIANVLLKATEAVTVGQRVVCAGTDGSVKAATGDQVDYLGTAQCTRTAGAANEMIQVLLNIQYVGDAVP